jgi:hypothetical protein
MKVGSVAKRDNETNDAELPTFCFCGIEPKAGMHCTNVTPNRLPLECAQFLQSVASW